jgi:hypothetical protein
LALYNAVSTLSTIELISSPSLYIVTPETTPFEFLNIKGSKLSPEPILSIRLFFIYSLYSIDKEISEREYKIVVKNIIIYFIQAIIFLIILIS